MAIRLQDHRKLLFGFGVAALTLGLCVTIVPESSQAVVLRMGDPVRVINRFRPASVPGQGGLLVHLPFVETVDWVDRGLQDFITERQPVRSRDDQLLEIDTLTTFRVFDPVKLINTVGSSDKAVAQMQAVLSAQLQQEYGQSEAGTLLRPGGGGANARLKATLDAKARGFGIQVIDLRLVGGALPAGAQREALVRMQSEREGLADTIAQQGARDAQLVTARAQADAARLLGDTAGKDPAFYDFYRAMRSYESVFADPNRKGDNTIVLGPDNAYLKQFNGK